MDAAVTVFISYSRHDKHFVDRLSEGLRCAAVMDKRTLISTSTSKTRVEYEGGAFVVVVGGGYGRVDAWKHDKAMRDRLVAAAAGKKAKVLSGASNPRAENNPPPAR